MANNIIKRVWNQGSMTPIEDLQGSAFTNENGGHTFQISGVDSNGEALALSGIVAASFLRPDQTTVGISGSVSGGVASVTLSEECYGIPGRFGLVVFLTSDGKKTAIYSCVGNVARSSTDAVAPGVVADVVDLINEIQAAVDTIPASYSALMADIAPTYSSSALYAVGDYAWYEGDLKRCIVPITVGETYTPAHWTSAVVGDDVCALKSAIVNSNVNVGCAYQKFYYNGDSHSSNTDKADIDISTGEKFYLSISSATAVQCHVFAYYSDGTNERIAVNVSTSTNRMEFSANKDIISFGLYLGANLTQQTISFTIESENSVFEKVNENKENILLSNNKGEQYILQYGNFQHYGLNTDGSFKTTQQYRVSNDDKMTFGYDIIVYVATGFKWGYIPFVDNVAGAWSGWNTEPITIPAGTVFNVQIARATEIYSEIANVEEFTDAITISTILLSRIVSLENTVNKHFDYSYNGKMIESKKGRYNMIQSNLFVPTPASISATSLQGFGIANGYIVQMYSGTIGKLSIVNMENGSVVASIDSNCEHGNSIDFFDTYYADDDILPIAFVSDGLTNRAYEARITASAVTILKNIVFPIETVGYFVSTMLDKNNLIVYTVGYKQNSYTSATNNSMIICAWDYSNLTDNGDSTYTPEYIKSFNIPFFTTLQGPTFHNGKLFIISSVSSMTEANTRIFVINPYEERIENILTQFPDNIKNVECEAIYFYETDDNVVVYVRSLGSTLPYYIMEFNS